MAEAVPGAPGKAALTQAPGRGVLTDETGQHTFCKEFHESLVLTAEGTPGPGHPQGPVSVTFPCYP